jgi:hypothetical protein
VDLQTIIGEVQTIKTGCKINLEVQTNLPITLKIETKMDKGSNSYKNATCWYCNSTGLLQTRCFKRIADQKPFVTKNNTVFLINGADVIPERGITLEEILQILQIRICSKGL